MDVSTKTYDDILLKNVHLSIPPPTSSGKTWITNGDFLYFHYNCDGYADAGWGCAYRTLQSACSWIANSLAVKNNIINVNNKNDQQNNEEENGGVDNTASDKLLPSILDIQQTLVNISDKPQSFLGSHEWIGALEVFYVIDTLYEIPCKILHIPHCEDVKKYANIVKQYFEDFGGFVMMGGDIDASSKGIAGIHISGNQAYFLVIDPHFVGTAKSAQELIEKGYVRWQHTSEFVDSSFYNLCLPLIKQVESSQNLKSSNFILE